MAKKQKLSHEEIWDDSALISSWDEALEEYKHYHSLHARGEKVEDVLREYENTNFMKDAEPAPADDNNLNATTSVRDAVSEDGELEDGEVGSETPANKVNEHNEAPTASPEEQAPAAAVPQALMASVQDENIKNLMMAWYYAGYYTGFYEGQQQNQQVPSSNNNSKPANGVT